MDHTSQLIAQLAQQLGEALKSRQYRLATAESCTGGMVSAAITEIAGSSDWFDRGFVTYSNSAKMDMLGVAQKTLETYGAVSEQTAEEMALGALKNSKAQLACSITGIAGPSGGSPEKPVGTVCFAWAGANFPLIKQTHHFTGDRQAVRQQSVITALQALLSLATQY